MNGPLSQWVGWLIDCESRTYGGCVLGCITAENAMGRALDPSLAFNTLPAAPKCVV